MTTIHRLPSSTGLPCAVCDRPRSEFPACFLGDPTCSVVCAKTLEART